MKKSFKIKDILKYTLECVSKVERSAAYVVPKKTLYLDIKNSLLGVLTLIVMVFGQSAIADNTAQIKTLDDLSFDTEISSYRIESSTQVTKSTDRQIQSVIDLHSEQQDTSIPRLNLDDVVGQPFKLQRFSNTIGTGRGALTVGRNWSNFQDFIGDENYEYDFDDTAVTSEQIGWRSPNGFGVALESEFLPYSGRVDSAGELSSTPSLILSWQGSDANNIGQYRISALGQDASGQKETGWGLNVAGGWQVGDFFAALSVTLGNSIDRFVIGQENITPSATSQVIQLNDSINVNPRLNYNLSENANLHLALNRYESLDENALHGIQTLDTIHVGYTWNPWPSTQFGVELVGKDVEGTTDIDSSSEVTFAVRKQL